MSIFMYWHQVLLIFYNKHTEVCKQPFLPNRSSFIYKDVP